MAILVAPLCAQKQPITDDTITDQVLVKLANDPDVGGMKFEVSVHEGAVTLKGKVRTDKQKSKAEKLAKKVKGVTSVNNRLVISPD
jgi:osmotically-inducible protein OsmY